MGHGENTPAEDEDVAPVNTGAMLALYPSTPENLAHDHGDAPDQLHCTIGYFGKAADLAPETEAFIREEMLERIEKDFNGGIEGHFSGAGVLGDDAATVLFVESADVQRLHDDVFAQLDEHGHQYAEQYPSYIPHVTLGYADGDPIKQAALFDKARSLVGEPVLFDRCGAVVADDTTHKDLCSHEPVDEEQVEEMLELLKSEDTAWYARKKIAASSALTAGSIFKHANWKGPHGLNPRALLTQDSKPDSIWNPILHPRGRDGRFIHTFGFIKWMDHLKWMRGEVIDINPSTGLLSIKTSSGAIKQVEPKKAYTIAPQKAVLALPSPKASDVENALKGWVKTGSQGGSNPGGTYKITEPKLTKPNIPFTVVKELSERHDLANKLIYGSGNDTVPGHALISTSDGRLIRRSDTSAYDVGTGEYLTADERQAVLTDPGKKFIGGGFQESAIVAKITADAEKLAKNASAAETSYYVKQSKSASHAANEVLANRLYEATGVPVASVLLGDKGDSVASKILENPLPLTEATPEQLSQIRRDFAIDAWLANWDAVGLVSDNIVIADGIPTRIDAGGALLYRAMGGPKGSMFGHNVTETGTLRDPYVNAPAAAVFGDVTDEELRDGVSRIAALHPAEIETAVLDAGLTHDLAATLIARRADLIKQTGVEDPHLGSPALPTKNDIENVAVDALPTHIENFNPAGLDNNEAVAAKIDSLDGDTLAEKLDGPLAETKLNEALVSTDAPVEEVAPAASVDTDAPLPSIGHKDLLLGDGVPFTALFGPDGSDYVDELIDTPVLVHLPQYQGVNSPYPSVALISSASEDNVILRHGAGASTLLLLDKHHPAFANAKFFPINSAPPASIIDAPPPTYVNGIVYANGEAVGVYAKAADGSSIATIIDADHSATGFPASFTSKGLSDAYKFVPSVLLPKDPLVSAPLTDDAHSVKEAIVHSTAPSTQSVTDAKSWGTLASGEAAVEGLWVESKNDGKVGQIVGAPKDTIKYSGYVYVLNEDGNKKLRSVKALQAVTKPAEENKVSEYLSQVVESTTPDAPPVPAEAGPYDNLSTADGKIPAIGQTVKAGKANSIVEGKITKINPSNNYVVIQDSTGKKTAKKLSTTYVLEEASTSSKEFSALAQPDKTLVSTADTAVKATKKSAPVPSTPAGPKYPSSSGVTWGLPGKSQIDTWLDGSPKRKLMKEDYVPTRGMLVRDSKGNLGVIIKTAKHYQSNPNGVHVWDFEQQKIVIRAANTLHVDHAASFAGKDGKPLPTVGAFVFQGDKSYDLPTGTKLYHVTGYNSSDKTPEEVSIETTSYLSVEPNGNISWFNGSQEGGINKGHASYSAAEKFLKSAIPFAVVDTDSPGAVIVTPRKQQTWIRGGYKAGAPGKMDITEDYDVYVHEQEVAKAEKEAAILEAIASGSVISPAVSVTHEQLTNFPADQKAIDNSPVGDNLGPELPTVTGILPDFKSYPTSIKQDNSATLADAATHAIEHKDSTDVGTSVHYGLADSDHIEDMLVRFQIIRDKDGAEKLELRFRLREDHAETLADTMFSAGGVKTGSWVANDLVRPSELSSGDSIAVRVASNGTNKPLAPVTENSTHLSPNAEVVKTEFIGIGENGLDRYRVTFSTVDGDVGQMDLEDRDSPSVNIFVYDPAVKVTQNGSMKPELTPRAEVAGWHVAGKGALPYEVTLKNEQDATGAGSITDPNELGFSAAYHGVDSLTRTVVNMLDDGTSVRAVLVPTWAGDTKNGTARRMTLAGEVRVAVPLEGDRQVDDDLLGMIGQALETVGIPPEQQGPPSDEQIALVGVNKFVNTFVSKWEYRANQIDSLGDPRIATTLERVNKELRTKLGRDVTIDDIHVRTYDTGRIQYVLSSDVADAITKNQKHTYFRHGGSGKSMVEVFGGVSSGLQSTDERWSAGIMYKGLSSDDDMREGSGDRVFLRAGLADTFSGVHGSNYVFHPNEINESLEVYAWDGDTFGRRKDDNLHIGLHATQEDNEWMYKRRLEPEQIGYYATSDYEARITALKDRGITHINGRPIEDIIVPPHKVDFTTAAWQKRRQTNGYKQVSIRGLIDSTAAPTVQAPIESTEMVGEVPMQTEGDTDPLVGF